MNMQVGYEDEKKISKKLESISSMAKLHNMQREDIKK